MEQVTPMDLRILAAIAAMQFGKHAATFLQDNKARINIERSKNTHKIRFIYLDGDLIFVLRPEEGFFSISIPGARILNSLERDMLINGIKVIDDVAEFIKDGKNVFAKHVVDPSLAIRPAQELYVCDGKRDVLAVGKAIISGRDMHYFKRGVAVSIRHGARKAGQGA
ncbi:MAG: PUA domain-containing protein [Candidatus Sigynarchaeota archaeon]